MNMQKFFDEYSNRKFQLLIYLVFLCANLKLLLLLLNLHSLQQAPDKVIWKVETNLHILNHINLAGRGRETYYKENNKSEKVNKRVNVQPKKLWWETI